VSHPDGLPDLFLDRSLGRVKVPRLLRAAGLRLVTLSEHYGIPADEDIADDEWLEAAGRRGWVVFMKDTGSGTTGRSARR
jgi:PIN like domain